MLKLIKCGYNYIHSDGIYIDRPAGSGVYAFVLFKSGADVVIEGRNIRVDRDTWMLLRPTAAYSYRDTEKPFVNDWFHFDGEETGVLLKKLGLPVDEPVHAVHSASVSRWIMELQNSRWLGGPHIETILDYDLQSFLFKLSNSLQLTPMTDTLARYFRPFSEIRNMLYSSPQTRYSVDALAAGVNLSKSYFQHIYKEMFGSPVSLDMINARLEYAKDLLENSSLSVGAVSKACGYENETHFMRQFKKFVGKTPSQYKKSFFPYEKRPEIGSSGV